MLSCILFFYAFLNFLQFKKKLRTFQPPNFEEIMVAHIEIMVNFQNFLEKFFFEVSGVEIIGDCCCCQFLIIPAAKFIFSTGYRGG